MGVVYSYRAKVDKRGNRRWLETQSQKVEGSRIKKPNDLISDNIERA